MTTTLAGLAIVIREKIAMRGSLQMPRRMPSMRNAPLYARFARHFSPRAAAYSEDAELFISSAMPASWRATPEGRIILQRAKTGGANRRKARPTK